MIAAPTRQVLTSAFPARANQGHFHVLRQAADVVVGLDRVGLAGLGAGGFDHVRVNGALGQPVHILPLARSGNQFIRVANRNIRESGSYNPACVTCL